MRTARVLTVSLSMLYAGGGVFLVPGVCLLQGGVCSQGVYLVLGGCLLPGGVCLVPGVSSGGVSAPGGMYLVPGGGACSGGCTWSGGVCSRGCLLPEGCLLQGGVCSWGGVRYSPLWTEWQTGAKILPCPKLRLRAVMNAASLVGDNNRRWEHSLIGCFWLFTPKFWEACSHPITHNGRLGRAQYRHIITSLAVAKEQEPPLWNFHNI